MAPKGPDGEALGDAVTLEALYDAHGALCYRLAYRVVGETQVASSIVHDVFLASWKAAAAVDPMRGSVQTWLLGLTHRRAVEVVRRTRQRPTRVSTGGALPNLSTEHGDVVELAYFGGLSQSEIAEVTGIGLVAVKARTLSALRQLRADFEARTAAHTAPASAVERVAVERDRVVEFRFPHLEPVVGQ